MVKQTRRTKTKDYIKAALAQLLSQKSFEKLSITAICQAAGINRATFYLHYKDKYDMIEQLREETLSQIYATITQEAKAFSPEVITETLRFLQRDMAFFSILAQSSYAKFVQTLRQFIAYILDNIADFEDFLTKEMDVPYKYGKIAYIASIEAVMTEWIISGGKESPEEMTAIILKIAA